MGSEDISPMVSVSVFYEQLNSFIQGYRAIGFLPIHAILYHTKH